MTAPVVPAAGESPVPVLVRLFDKDPALAGGEMRRLVRASPEAFRASAIEALKTSSGGRGYRFLIAQLLANGLFVECLLAPALSAAEAAELGREAARVEPAFDIQLARHIAGEAANPSAGCGDAGLARLLEVFAGLDAGLPAVSALGPLQNHPNPRLRSKAALLMVRAAQSAELAAKQLSSPDARVRANAVEALWRSANGNCRPIFEHALRDPNCRVAGNAALGLYLMGDTAGVRELADMVRRPEPEFRATAAWCMGATGDPRFLPALERLAAGEGGRARQNALRAVSRIRPNAARMAGAGLLRIEIAAASLSGPSARLALAVAAENEPDLRGLPATSFIVLEDGEPVADYCVEETRGPESLAAGFALPEWLAGNVMADCDAFRRPGDSWTVATYAEPEAADQSCPALDESLGYPGRACRSLYQAARELLKVSVLARRVRHLVLLAGPSGLGEDAADDLAAAARTAGAAIHVVALPGFGTAELDALAARTGGRSFRPGIEEGIAESMQRACLGMLSRYEVTWRSCGGRLQIQVWCERGCGERSYHPPAVSGRL